MNAIYIVASRTRRLYIGVTSNLNRRVWQHKTKAFDGFTSQYNIDRLVYFENYDDMRVAINREKQLKRWRRDKKLALIERLNPCWIDLAEDWYQ
ncbi:MAG TPA: GIY-YIG nuclease family protein [Terriglobales bacterium]|nr:GIY-YIG nuclease family protein [Terriglobales bacterium]